MKKTSLIAICLGSMLFVSGAVLFSVGIINTHAPLLTREYDIGLFSNFNIDITTANIEFKVSQDGSNKVVCEEKEKDYHFVEIRNETLFITNINVEKWYENIFDFNFEKMKITIYTPITTFDYGKIKSSTGDVIINENYTFNSLNVNVSTGDIEIKSNVKETLNIEATTGDICLETTSNNLNIKTTTGDINLKNIEVNDDININASTGEVKISDLKSKTLKVVTSTGDINLKNVLVEENLFIKTSTGVVNIIDSDAFSLNIFSSTGDVNMILLSTKKFEIFTNTGRKDYPESDSSKGLCKVQTSTGNITIRIKK